MPSRPGPAVFALPQHPPPAAASPSGAAAAASSPQHGPRSRSRPGRSPPTRAPPRENAASPARYAHVPAAGAPPSAGRGGDQLRKPRALGTAPPGPVEPVPGGASGRPVPLAAALCRGAVLPVGGGVQGPGGCGSAPPRAAGSAHGYRSPNGDRTQRARV